MDTSLHNIDYPVRNAKVRMKDIAIPMNMQLPNLSITKSHLLSPGDMLDKVSSKELADKKYWWILAKVNGIVNPIEELTPSSDEMPAYIAGKYPGYAGHNTALFASTSITEQWYQNRCSASVVSFADIPTSTNFIMRGWMTTENTTYISTGRNTYTISGLTFCGVGVPNHNVEAHATVLVLDMPVSVNQAGQLAQLITGAPISSQISVIGTKSFVVDPFVSGNYTASATIELSAPIPENAALVFVPTVFVYHHNPAMNLVLYDAVSKVVPIISDYLVPVANYDNSTDLVGSIVNIDSGHTGITVTYQTPGKWVPQKIDRRVYPSAADAILWFVDLDGNYYEDSIALQNYLNGATAIVHTYRSDEDTKFAANMNEIRTISIATANALESKTIFDKLDIIQ